ncbi:hypothetical protein DTO217A2_4026 [Paecilomyces variotii]|nr:hypothetical protein DTO217A2_4026 [Paecilomyces variotii]
MPRRSPSFRIGPDLSTSLERSKITVIIETPLFIDHRCNSSAEDSYLSSSLEQHLSSLTRMLTCNKNLEWNMSNSSIS